MTRPRNTQEFFHWLEVGAGARWIVRGALVFGVLALSLVISWGQFRGPLTEGTLLQADLGRQIASGQGFTTLVNFPQTSAVMARRGMRFDPAKPYPELTQAPLYALLIAGGLRLIPAATRDELFTRKPEPPDGFGGDYFLLGLNVVLFWIAAWLTYDLGRRLFSPRVGWLASLALLVSVSAWQQVVAVNGVPLLMVLALLAFRVWVNMEDRALATGGAAPLPACTGLGLMCGLLFLTEYSAGTLVLVALIYAAVRFRGAARGAALGLIALGFILVTSPWIVRNLRLTGQPVALATQNVALKAGDSTAEPSTFRGRLSTEMPQIKLNKLGNKALTTVQDNVKSRLWSGGLFLTAFFVAGWLYVFRAPTANRLRWMFTLSLAVLVAAQAFLNSGETERLPVLWLAPLIIIFGAGFFFVLLEASPSIGGWPRLAATLLLLAQGLPLLRDALEPRRFHFSYPPYFPALLIGLRVELELRGGAGSYGAMADIPAGAAWYGRQRVWALPTRLRDFYAVTVDQPIAELLLTPRTLDRPFFSELAVRGPGAGSLGESAERFGEWGQIYTALVTGRWPPGFPLTQSHKVADNLYLLFNPALPPPRGK